MTDSGCTKAKAELEEYLHNELCKEDAADIREHMAGCVDCADEAKVGVVLTVAVQRACKETAPEDLRAQVLGMLRDEHAAHSSASARL
ncbi:alpha-ketoglutarate decarboxylase [Rathayibacter rathayi]|uniref:Alpha-ketoglutarate decarboxylase n=1 Tax=Rathayibacter rathayi TaxID=33887 RepID=A0ABD6W7J8_RATRA|nr:zf-HC2 domain-containing protein [Rathayibacter rathayi]AZZ49304.1 alpha-ketoglutarate decarboxylase [Rathayibacter rathayi]MWV73387.1 alpha-ketoglutarate decarboxylase [Rathayibacter rathayi NCPPB 2980 = VKM Ac-1601]PPF12742.1 alpha-ketoglutarate decarboxylase [Rathayibacter rathayi]PPF20924.1 alpha-ketoglutarate decarboxylase [Rathayibacter rathayi]PPF44029.1 alpha-ketoglutarate decarboxylase [Rathayibacter rathayi]